MPRNACRRHPRKKVIEIPEGYRYCERCHHLVPPVKEVALEAESEPLTEKVGEVLKVAAAAMSAASGVAKRATEAKLTEEIEAVEEVTEEAIAEFYTEAVEAEEQPEETPVEAEPEPSAHLLIKLKEQPLEAESEAIKETLDILEDASYDDLLPPETDKKAEIARLKAELAELTK